MDYESKMAAMKSMMDYADYMEDEPRKKAVGIGSEEYNEDVNPEKSSQIDEEHDEESQGNMGEIGGLVKKFLSMKG